MASMTVQHLSTTYRTHAAAAHHPSPQGRLDNLLSTAIPESCADALADSLPDTDDVWLIQRLSADVAIDTSWPDSTIARAIAGSWTTAVTDTLARGPNGTTVLRYPNRATFLARFLIDHVAGAAHDHWPYRSLEPLPRLPVATVLIRLAEQYPSTAPRLLARLDEWDAFEQVTATLSTDDVQQLLDALAQQQARPEPTGATISALVDAWRSLPSASHTHRRSGTLRSLHATVRAYRHETIPSIATAATTIGLLPHLVRMLHATSPSRPASGPADGDHAAGPAARLLPSGTVTVSTSPPRSDAEHRRPSPEAPLHTPYGGAFLLLPGLCEAWPHLERIPAVADNAPTLRRRLLTASLGQRHDIADPVLDLLSGTDDPARPPALQPSAVEHAICAYLATRRIWPPAGLHLQTDAATGLAVTSDASTGTWLSLDTCGEQDAARRLAARLAELCATCSPSDRSIRLSDGIPGTLEKALAVHGLHVSRGPLDEPARRTPPPAPPHLVAADLSYLAGAAHPSDVAERSVMLLARLILRRFSGRLPGFADATAGHLARNYLHSPGDLHVSDDTWLAVLRPPPLAVLLRIAGLDTTLEPPWLTAPVTITLGPD